MSKYGQARLCRTLQDEDMCISTPEGVNAAVSSCLTEFCIGEFYENHAIIEGLQTLPTTIFGMQCEPMCLVNDKKHAGTWLKYDYKESISEQPYNEKKAFKFVIPLDSAATTSIKFGLQIGDEFVLLRNFRIREKFPICNQWCHQYFASNGRLIQWNSGILYVKPASKKRIQEQEKLFCKQLWRSSHLWEKKVCIARVLVSVLKKFKKKPLWLVSDRFLYAGDNGEAFFRYMQSEHKKEINTVFVLSKKSKDYKNMKAVGNVVDNRSFLHKILFLLCDYNISSHVDGIAVHPFCGHDVPYRDLMHTHKFVFLQHGVAKDDLSGWLNRFNKNLHGFVTSANPEYDSILNGNYLYTEKEVWLTGLPRFDRLYHANKKQIVFMPTWRKYLLEATDSKTGIRPLAPGFAESEYFRFYSVLFQNERLAAAAEKYGYKLCFYPHPEIKPYAEMFTQGTKVTTIPAETPYRRIYAESSLIVSDYSSTVFDFAYLRKPVIHTQFDKDVFFSGKHIYGKGYFDYERDGFGEVEYDLDGAVNRIIEYMENDCQLKDKYRERIDQFFAFHDQNNCRRVYEKIMEM